MPAPSINYPSSAATMVFGVYFSALAAFRLDRKSPAIRHCVQLPTFSRFLKRYRFLQSFYIDLLSGFIEFYGLTVPSHLKGFCISYF